MILPSGLTIVAGRVLVFELFDDKVEVVLLVAVITVSAKKPRVVVPLAFPLLEEGDISTKIQRSLLTSNTFTSL